MLRKLVVYREDKSQWQFRVQRDKNVVIQTSHLVLSELWHGTGMYIYGKDKRTENTDQNISCKADFGVDNVKPWVILPDN